MDTPVVGNKQAQDKMLDMLQAIAEEELGEAEPEQPMVVTEDRKVVEFGTGSVLDDSVREALELEMALADTPDEEMVAVEEVNTAPDPKLPYIKDEETRNRISAALQKIEDEEKAIEAQVKKFLGVLSGYYEALKKYPGPVKGVFAFAYLKSKANAVLISQETRDEKKKSISSLFVELTALNCARVAKKLGELSSYFPESDMRVEVATLRKVFAEKEQNVSWIRKGDKAIRDIYSDSELAVEVSTAKIKSEVAKFQKKAEAQIRFWGWVLPKSVAQKPIDDLRSVILGQTETQEWLNEAYQALDAARTFTPICGCGCNRPLKRIKLEGGKEGKYYGQCFDSFAKLKPELAKRHEGRNKQTSAKADEVPYTALQTLKRVVELGEPIPESFESGKGKRGKKNNKNFRGEDKDVRTRRDTGGRSSRQGFDES